MTSSVFAIPTARAVAESAGSRLMDAITAGWLSTAVCVAAKLDIAERLADGPKTPATLAREVGATPDSLARLLRVLAASGIFRELPGGCWDLTPAAALLRRDVPGSLRGLARFCGAAGHYRAWGALEYSVRCGDEAYSHVHDESLWQSLLRDPDLAGDFNEAMTGVSRRFHAGLIAAYDFSQFGTIVDVGGGHGELIFNLLDRYRHVRGVIFDLPAVIEGTKRRIAEHALGDRCSAIAGDFFEAVPERGDAYVLTHVVHDWDDEAAGRILRNVRAAMRADATLILGEHVLAAANLPDFAKLLDLEMLVMTQGGRERTRAEFEGLLRASGFATQRIVDTPSGTKVIEAVPV